ncbi:hypothetical protein [Brevibacillus sp. NRS-1366]|uniref:hypothetical protein n=1 Tax=Brevibacillus sp. NRS-1366 TaxID=3233899 RepID=UPI003D1B6456
MRLDNTSSCGSWDYLGHLGVVVFEGGTFFEKRDSPDPAGSAAFDKLQPAGFRGASYACQPGSREASKDSGCNRNNSVLTREIMQTDNMIIDRKQQIWQYAVDTGNRLWRESVHNGNQEFRDVIKEGRQGNQESIEKRNSQ